MSRPVFDRLAVVGLGLVGGSVALAARERGVARDIRGVDPALAAVDAQGIPLLDLEVAAGWADGVVVAVPIAAFDEVFSRLAPRLREGAILTDTASVKGPVADAARRLLVHPERCVGAHPMAGGDRTGIAFARPDLFEGAACILTPEGTEPASVVDRVEEFWQGLGALTVRKTPGEHDAICAVLSHAPHVIAFAFARGLPGPEELALAGQGLRDFTRIARSNPRLWREILLMNRARVAEELSRFEKHLGEIQDALARGDGEGLEALLASATRALAGLDR
jgi:prephenate dehydrogenase